jgi:hypothetical protein
VAQSPPRYEGGGCDLWTDTRFTPTPDNERASSSSRSFLREEAIIRMADNVTSWRMGGWYCLNEGEEEDE